MIITRAFEVEKCGQGVREKMWSQMGFCVLLSPISVKVIHFPRICFFTCKMWILNKYPERMRNYIYIRMYSSKMPDMYEELYKE